MAAASFDNVLCISAFGVCLGIAFDSGELADLYKPRIVNAMFIGDLKLVYTTWGLLEIFLETSR